MLPFSFAAALAAGFPAECRPPAGGRLLETDYLEHRYAVRVPRTAGPPLRFYLDTGGGANMVYRPTVERLRLSVDSAAGAPPGAGTVPADRLAIAPEFPPLPAEPGRAPELFAPPPNPMYERDGEFQIDGFLGRTWFARRVWTFDYPGRAMRFHGERLDAPGPAECWVPLGFQTDSTGARTSHFPRVTAVVDGDSLEFLFDTGAMTALTPAALDRLADGGPAKRGTSFITKAISDRWRSRHPDWPVIEEAEAGTGAAMIRAAGVTIGRVTTGPVWFTVRPDGNFHRYMSQWMDRRLDGALGGSSFRELIVTIDYPNARAQFVKP